ncbi:MAG: cyclic nucleotide-binding domain-containing protein [Acidobacteriota bacterium]|nr:cyclic nucleotide-binding domain-containing protein [Acidobacteriota bacterium]
MPDPIDRELLANSAIFADLDDDELDKIASICEARALKWGEYVFHEGDDGDRLYLITKGAVRISRNVPGTGEEAITVLKKAACFGEMAMLDPSTRSTDAIVDSRCDLLTIARTDFEALMESDRELAYKVLRAVIRILSERLRQTNDNLKSIFVIAMF